MKKLLLLSAIFASQTLVAQNVGIGTTAPLAKLHISNGASGNTTPFSPLVVESNANTFINLLSPNTNETGLLFGKADNAASGAIVYNNVNTLNGFQFRTAGNITQMILNNAGNVGIGLSTPNAKLSISADGTELVGTASGTVLRTNAGNLGNVPGDELSLANIGFLSSNNSSLGIRAYRTSSGTGWEKTAILLGMDVDNTGRAGGGFLAISANGNIGVNTGTPQVSAALDVSSTTKGALMPRMTTAQRNAIASPATGLQIYNIDNNCLEIWNSVGWLSVCSDRILFNGITTIGCVNSWTKKNDYGGAIRNNAIGFSIGTKGYIGTGDNNSIYKKDFWEYDPASNAWTQKADFGGTARSGAVAFSIGSKGYVGTGYGSSNSIKKDFWEYDPGSNTWTQKTDFGGTARSEAVGFSIVAKGYIGTGFDGAAFKKDFWEYDPAGNTWTQKADFGGTARSEAVGFSIGSKGYIGTGDEGAYNRKKDFWEYDPGSNTWTQKTDFGGAVASGATGFSIDSKGYIGALTVLENSFWEYDPISNTWKPRDNFGGSARDGATGFSIGSKGYIGTGYDGTSKKDFWEYCQ